MMPDSVLSTENIPSAIEGARGNSIGNKLFDLEDGGIYIGDPSEGLSYQVWQGEITDEKTKIKLSSPTTPATTIITGADITELSFSFDQNMNPAIAYVDDGVTKFYWYDSTIEDYTTTVISGTFPKVFLDDKRPKQGASSDVLLFYIRSNSLFFRMQRDRYEVEYLLKSNLCELPKRIKLERVGMGKNLRLQFITKYY